MQNSCGLAWPTASMAAPDASAMPSRMLVNRRADMNREAASQMNGPAAVSSAANAKYMLYSSSVSPKNVMYTYEPTAMYAMNGRLYSPTMPRNAENPLLRATAPSCFTLPSTVPS